MVILMKKNTIATLTIVKKGIVNNENMTKGGYEIVKKSN